MKYLSLFTILSLAIVAFGQQNEIIANQYSHFSISSKKDTIDFVVADTSLQVKKPVLLFCQGSLPLPLFVDFGENRIAPIALSNFDVDYMKEAYHIVVISMPKTPVIVSKDHVNRSYCYITDPENQQSFSPEYVRADFKQNYVDRANKVIRYLRKQDWVDATKIVVAGHSQGSRVAVSLASSNKHVTQLGLFGYNPMRRIDQLVWTYRERAKQGEISWEQADSLQQQQYQFYQDILNDKLLAEHPQLKSWRSFSTNSTEELSSLKIPVYIAFGSEDIIAEHCDLLPLDFAEKGKTNFVLKRYANMDHNFFPLNDEGRPDRKNGQWKAVMNAFIDWSKM